MRRDARLDEGMVRRKLPGGEVEFLAVLLAGPAGDVVLGHHDFNGVDSGGQHGFLDLLYRHVFVFAPGQAPVEVEHRLVWNRALRGAVHVYLRDYHRALAQEAVVVRLEGRVERFHSQSGARRLVRGRHSALGG